MLKVLCVFAALGAAAFQYRASYPSSEMNFVLRVEVNTPEGPRVGQSVLKARIARYPSIMGDAGMNWSFEGDAIAVPMLNQDVLFIPLITDHVVRLPERAAGFSNWGGGPNLGSRWAEIEARGPINVPTEALPLFVRSRDTARPETVMKVDSNDLSGHFGPGHTLRAVTVTATAAPVTRTIDRWLPWLDRYRHRQLDGSTLTTSPPSFANSLSASNFRM